MNRYFCGITLCSKIKGNIKKVGFYDNYHNIHHKINLLKSKTSKIFNLKLSESKYFINVNKVLNSTLQSFKSDYVYIFPITDELFYKIYSHNNFNSINYKEIAKQFGLEEWLV